MSVWDKIRGTTETLFQIGRRGGQLKNNGGVIEHRNPTDSGFGITRGADPVGNDDLLTLRYFNANNASANQCTVVKMPLAQATKVSSVAIPDNAVILQAILDVGTSYNGTTPTFVITRTGDGTKVLMAVGDSDLEAAPGTWEVPQVTNWGATGAGTVTATFAGTGVSTGAAVLYIVYVIPTDIS